MQMVQPVENSRYVREPSMKLRTVGKGGTGTVEEWLLSCGETVAIKRFSVEGTGPDREVSRRRSARRASREAETLKDLDHQNIVCFHEYIKHGEDHCLVLELVGGRNIHRLIKEQRRNDPKQLESDDWYKKVIKLTRQLLLGLQYLHETKCILHFDIKTDNLLVTEDGILKICDFGLSCKMDTSLVGPRRAFVYAAPELLKTKMNDPSLLSISDNPGAIDVWSVGCVVFKMLTGKDPFLPDPTTSDRAPTELDDLSKSAEQLKRIKLSIGFLKDLPPDQNPSRSQMGTGSQECPLSPDWELLKVMPPKFIKFLKACWELEPGKRKTCSDLLEMDLFQNKISGDDMG
eukprot:jgi/Botrbrau1/8888/Bobra.0148s0008.1